MPDGVEVIGDYAFAGCYTAKKVVLPPSVVSIGPKSFDEGDYFRSDIQMPESLYEFVYRLPALSSINGQQKSALWEQRKNGRVPRGYRHSGKPEAGRGAVSGVHGLPDEKEDAERAGLSCWADPMRRSRPASGRNSIEGNKTAIKRYRIYASK